MSRLLENVDLKTQLAGQNRLELLLFTLKGRQKYGINVFKVREVVQCPPLTQLPGANSVIRGVASLRGQNISVMDISHAIGGPVMEQTQDNFLIVTEYNRSTLGFLVGSVERIINTNWENVLPPPKGIGRGTYMTAVTKIDDELVEIIDVEKILSEVIGVEENLTQPLEQPEADLEHIKALIVDDSVVARKQIEKVLKSVGISCILAENGAEALDMLKSWSASEHGGDRLPIVISDIEMPIMDGYTLVTEIRKHQKLKELFVIMHSSLSGVFNEDMVKKVGADHFLPKFNADELAQAVNDRLKTLA
jgi:two-component system chemotaxis response regulator CheV